MPSTLNPTCEKEIAGESVTFRELRAIEGIEFLKKLSVYAAQLQSPTGDSITARLSEVILGAEDVSTFLVLKSAQKGKEWLDKISTEEFLEALQTAIDLNITDTVVKKAQGVANSIKQRMPGTTPSTPLPEASNS